MDTVVRSISMQALFLAPVAIAVFVINRKWNSLRARSKAPFQELRRRPAGDSLRLKLETLDEQTNHCVFWLLILPAVTASKVVIKPPANSAVLVILLLPAIAWTIFFARRLWRLLRDRANYQLGFDGERYVGEELTQLVAKNFEVYHDLPFDGFNINHVRVDPAGVIAVETKSRRKPIAASVGQGMAILCSIAGLFFNPFLLFIALFVFLGAQTEAEMVGMQQLLRGRTVRDAMLTRFRTLPAEATLDDAVRELLAGSQQDFLVLSGDALVGVLMRNDLVKAVAEGGRAAAVGSAVRRSCAVVEASEPLRAAFDKMRQDECSTLPVMQNGRLVGMLTLENVGELVMVSEAASQFDQTS